MENQVKASMPRLLNEAVLRVFQFLNPTMIGAEIVQQKQDKHSPLKMLLVI